MDDPKTSVEGRPPALPIKQRRSFYSQGSSCSSVETTSGGSSTVPPSPMPSPGLHTVSPLSPISPCDCFAPECPIHHRYDSHQERYFSEKTPPPVPKKRLARTLSLPEGFPCPSSIYSSSSSQTVPLSPFAPNFVRLSPLDDTVFHPDGGDDGSMDKGTHEQPSPCLPLPQLDFDNLDEQLSCFLPNVTDPLQTSGDLRRRLLLFMRGAVEKMDRIGAGKLMPREVILPQDLELCTEDWPTWSQGTTLHGTARCPKLQGKKVSITVCKEPAMVIPSVHLESHANIQKVLAYFQNNSIEECQTQGGSSDKEILHEDSGNKQELSVLSLLQQGYRVTVSPDVTQGSLEEFVQEGKSFYSCHPEVYHKRTLLLMLQLAQALLHLKTHNIQVTNLDPQMVHLAWSDGEWDRERVKRKETKVTQGTTGCDTKAASPCGVEDRLTERHSAVKQANECSGKLWDLWTSRGVPRALITSCPLTAKSHEPITSHQVQLGLLFRHCLHIPMGQINPAGALLDSTYSRGLRCLLCLLLAPQGELQMADTIPLFQSLLWGPGVKFPHHDLPAPVAISTINHWVLVKRFLLLLKLAERGLFPDQSANSWEDYLCLQYFGLADPHSVLSAVKKLRGAISPS